MVDTRSLYLGPRLKRLRRELGLTQQAMAEDIDVSASYVALLERNQRPLTAPLLLRLARTYKLEIADLAADEGQDYARKLIDTFEDSGVEYVVVNSAGCGSTMKEYAELLADDPGARVDIPVWCRLKDQQLVAQHDRPEGGWVFQVRRAR